MLLVFATLPATAAALHAPGHVELSAPVEVPLLAGPDAADPGAYVLATAGDTTLLVRLATGHGELRLTRAAADRLGAKVRGASGSPPTGGHASLPALTVGGASFTGLRAEIAPVRPSGDIPVDAELGLPGFPDLAWALTVSRGTLTLAPTSAGAQLPRGAGATTSPLPTAADRRTHTVRAGKAHDDVLAAPLFPATVRVSGVDLPAAWAIEAPLTTLVAEAGADVAWEMPDPPAWQAAAKGLPPAPRYAWGGSFREWRELGIAGVARSAEIDRPGAGPLAVFEPPVLVGGDVAATYDLFVSPQEGVAGLASASPAPRPSAIPALVAAAQADVDAAVAKGAEADVLAGKRARVAALQAAAGDVSGAVETWRAVVQAQPDRCEHHLHLGDALLAAGDATGAADAYGRADTLYMPWAKLDLAVRTQQRKAWDDAKKAGREWTATVPQSGACFVAAGHLATALVALERWGDVAALYPARLDLDPGLASAAGTAAFARGASDDARAAWLQALELRRGAVDPAARIGLFLARREADPAAAGKQVEALRLRWDGGTDALLAIRYAASYRTPSDSVRALQELLADTPDDPILLWMLAQMQDAAGQPEGATTWRQAEATLMAQRRAHPTDARWAAGLALFYAAQSDADKATQLAKEATQLDPASPMAWLAASDAALSRGDRAAASIARDRARVVGAANPAYALLPPLPPPPPPAPPILPGADSPGATPAPESPAPR